MLARYEVVNTARSQLNKCFACARQPFRTVNEVRKRRDPGIGGDESMIR